MRKILITLLFFVQAAVLFSAEVTLSGAGATFPEPLYAAYFNSYYQQTKVKINYQGIGSGGGIKQLINKTVAFGGTDAPMNEAELKDASSPVLHLPTCVGAVVVTYNLPALKTPLKLTPAVISGIFMGQIRKWNDPKIAAVNPGTALPDLAVTVVRRSDGSGTTYVFTDYLSQVSPEWKAKYGANKVINWPVGVGGKGNPGVAQYVKMMPGAIGYIELAYASQAKMAVAQVQNKAGQFVTPTLKSISAAADVKMPADTRVSIVNTSAPSGYPISSLSWLIFYQDLSVAKLGESEAAVLTELLWWITHAGQKINETKEYGALPAKVVLLNEKIIKSVVFNGKALKN